MITREKDRVQLCIYIPQGHYFISTLGLWSTYKYINVWYFNKSPSIKVIKVLFKLIAKKLNYFKSLIIFRNSGHSEKTMILILWCITWLAFSSIIRSTDVLFKDTWCGNTCELCAIVYLTLQWGRYFSIRVYCVLVSW